MARLAPGSFFFGALAISGLYRPIADVQSGSRAAVLPVAPQRPLADPARDIARRGCQSQLLAINGPSELAVRMSALGRKADLRSQRPLFRRLRLLRP